MSTGARGLAVDERGPSLKTRVAAVAILLLLAGLAAYAMFSGPTIAQLPSSGAAKAPPSKVAPPADEQFPEGREGGSSD
jgi:hypothetical protein